MSQAIQIGDNCPTFSLPDSQGKQIQMTDYLGQRILVLFFYPKDDTPGCTVEACAFRDNLPQFKPGKAAIFGRVAGTGAARDA